MKGLILAAGKGTRLRPLTYTRPKHLVPVGNRPVLAYVLDYLAQAGVREVGIVVAPDSGREIRKVVGDGAPWGMRVAYVVQEEPKGLAHAVACARSFLGDDPFLLMLGDNLFQGGIADALQGWQEGGTAALALVKEVADPRRFGVVEVDAHDRPLRLVEKPREPKSNLAIIGVYAFTPVVHQVIAQLKPSARGELEITDALQALVERGARVRIRRFPRWWLDLGRKEEVLEANRRVLQERTSGAVQGILEDCQVSGVVEVGAGSHLRGSILRGPLSIGANCVIHESDIGPWVSLGDGTHVQDSTVVDSVVLEGSSLHGVHLRHSLLGAGCRVEGEGQGWLTLFLGDEGQVHLHPP
ncbi:MAG: glucose-1-phosphate thymidylyltransferase [Dehalococcoidia bacterium]|nr:glucose-1-phosphate thymidylyltransferase [Dehalococcoidia bacterium]MDW8120054.1 glucose-1-phosphate thymidylyltransferase [Chloroflexota bacterium]